MKRPFAILLAAVILVACAPNAAPRLMADEPAPEIVGFPDAPQALEAFVAAVAARSDVPIPERVVSRSTQGGALYPRLTLLYMSAQDWCGSGGCRTWTRCIEVLVKPVFTIITGAIVASAAAQTACQVRDGQLHDGARVV